MGVAVEHAAAAAMGDGRDEQVDGRKAMVRPTGELILCAEGQALSLRIEGRRTATRSSAASTRGVAVME